MICRKCLCLSAYKFRRYCSKIVNKNIRSELAYKLRISNSELKFLSLKYPVITKLDAEQIHNLTEAVEELGFKSNTLAKHPALFSILPITLKHRYTVLDECGIQNISADLILEYLNTVRQKTIGVLKKKGIINQTVNIENRLASYMTHWPTSLTTLILNDSNEKTLFEVRLKIIQRYLELVLDLREEEFYRGLATYPTIKHRPLKNINETMTLLQSCLMMPTQKIKNNLYLVHANPENIKDLIYKLKLIGGIDIKEILRARPKLCMAKYSNIVEIQKILHYYNISNEAQKRCFELFTLAPETVRHRLQNAKNVPEFDALSNHPRFLKMIYYNKTAVTRMLHLYKTNKKCLSLNVLSGSSEQYKMFEKAPGDRLGKGKDLLFCLSQEFGSEYNINDLRKMLKRHPFWMNVPMIHVKYIYSRLKHEFAVKDIYENCPILLYPWTEIKELLLWIQSKKGLNKSYPNIEYVNVECLNKSQILSLILYYLEQKHYFAGNGIWSEDKLKELCNVNKNP